MNEKWVCLIIVYVFVFLISIGLDILFFLFKEPNEIYLRDAIFFSLFACLGFDIGYDFKKKSVVK